MSKRSCARDLCSRSTASFYRLFGKEPGWSLKRSFFLLRRSPLDSLTLFLVIPTAQSILNLLTWDTSAENCYIGEGFSVTIAPAPVRPTSLDRIIVRKCSVQTQAAAVSTPPFLVSSPCRLTFSPHCKPPSLPQKSPAGKASARVAAPATFPFLSLSCLLSESPLAADYPVLHKL